MKNFITTDLVLTATLAYFGQNLLDVKKDIGNDVEFIFDETPDIKQLMKSFSLGELTVEPRRFAIVLKDVKKNIYLQR